MAYHDTEWGVPQHDDAVLFEMLCLEGAQAGLSWLTILRKRSAYRRAYLRLRERHGSFDAYLWRHVGGRPIRRRPPRGAAPRTRSPASDALSKALRADGFRFVGTTICYAFMQAVGMLDEHQRHCAFGKRRGALKGAASPRSARTGSGAVRR